MNYLDTLESVAVSFSATNDNIVIAAPGAGKYLAIDFLMFVPSADVTLTLYKGTHAAGTALSGALPFKANQPIIIENAIKNEHGVITCDDNLSFNIYSSGSSTITGLCRYRIINK
jgi:hypothetical protein